MTHTPRRTPGFSGSDSDFTDAPNAEARNPEVAEDFEEHVPEEVHSDPELWFDICNDPAIWPENKAAAYRAALRGECDWQFASADHLRGTEATAAKPAGRNSRPRYLRRVK